MKIIITTDRNPFVNGAKAANGSEHEVSAADGKFLIKNGFAKEVKSKAAPKKAAKK